MIKVNIAMKDGTELKEVLLFKTKDLSDSEIKSKAMVKLILDGEIESLKQVHFCGKYANGVVMLQQIASYKIIDDGEEIREILLDFINKKNTIYDLNYPDVADFIMENKEELLKILK